MVAVSTPPALDRLKDCSVFDEAVPTPLVYLERPVLQRNIERMAAAAHESGVALRPHAKTHKLGEVARLQLEAGASGLTVAKLGEAEALVAAASRRASWSLSPTWAPRPRAATSSSRARRR
jgi:D-serine deaminase-like pyridoxal phosphate-dependent protein